MHSLAARYFFEVATTGSLSAASASLHVAISAISRQISTLEEEVGTPLFVRTARGMVLTDAGELLLRHVRRTQLETDAVLQSITALKGGGHSTIRIACTQGLANEFVPATLADFRRQYPDIRFRIWVDRATQASQRVMEGEADIAITFSTLPAGGVDVLYTHSAPALAVMSENHKLAHRRRLDIRELASYPLALTDEHTSTFRLFQLATNMAGIKLEPVIFSNHGESLHGFVRDSDAILFASYISIGPRLERNRLVAIPLRNPEMRARTVQVQVMQGRVLPDIVKEFVDFSIQRLSQTIAEAPG